MGRWQISNLILSPAISLFNGTAIWGTPTSWLSASVANLVGGAIFFWVDRFIFTSGAVEVWNFKDYGICDQCGEEESLWRLVRAQNYNKTNSVPVFLCMKCSKKKTDELRKRGIKIRGKSK